MAANFAGREAMWLKQLLTELGYHIPKLTIYCDSQPAIAVSKNPEHHSRMKHIDVCCDKVYAYIFHINCKRERN